MDHKLLENAPLFKDVAPEEIDAMLQCLGTEEKEYEKGEIIFHAGDVIHSIGLVLTGRVQIENDDLWGNKSVLESVGPGFAFAESYACLPGEPLMVSAIAAEPSRILFLDTGRVLTAYPSACSHHSRLVQNLLYISSQKNLNLSAVSSTPLPSPYGAACYLICPSRLLKQEARIFIFLLTDSS